MSKTLSDVIIHIIFSTKNREPWLTLMIYNEVVKMFEEICSRLGCASLAIGGFEDHLHTLCNLSRRISISDLVRTLKSDSMKTLHERYQTLKQCSWQVGYACFSADPRHLDPLIRYINTQKEHHTKQSFTEELRKLLIAFGENPDDPYIWN